MIDREFARPCDRGASALLDDPLSGDLKVDLYEIFNRRPHVALAAHHPLPDRFQIRDLETTDLPPIDAPSKGVPFNGGNVNSGVYSRDAFLPLTHSAPRPLAFSAKSIHRSVPMTKPFDLAVS